MKLFFGSFARFTSILLSTVIILNGLILPSPAKAKYIPQELVDKRTEYSKTYLNEDGSFTVKAYMEPVHYKEESGQLEEIDNNLESASASDQYSYNNKANDFKVKFKKSLKEQFPISIDNGEHQIAINMPTAEDNILNELEDSVSTQKNKIEHKDKSGKLKIIHTIMATKVKEDILLLKKPKGNKFVYELKAPNLTIEKSTTGSLILKEQSGKTKARINPMIMFEGTELLGEEQEVKTLEPIIEADGDKTTLTYTDTEGWLAEKDRKYPVTVDPTIELDPQQPVADAFITQNTNFQNTNYGQNVALRVTKSTAFDRRSLIKFADPSVLGIPNDAKILSASFSMYRYNSTQPTARIKVRRVLSSWLEGTGTAGSPNSEANGATWNERYYGAPWTTTGGYAHSTAEVDTNYSGIGWWSFDITKVFRQWLVGDVENNGLLVEAVNNGDDPWFYSRQSSSENRPYLSVTYIPNDNRIGIGNSWTYQDVSVGPGINASINVENGNLVVTKSLISIPGRGVPVQITPTYNSQESNIDSKFGAKWTWGFGYTLSGEYGTDPIILKDPSGAKYPFYRNANNQYIHPPGKNGKLTYANNKFSYKEVDGTTYNFDTSKRLSTIVDVKGNTTTYNYDIFGGLTSITDASGRVTSISRDLISGHVLSITDPAGRITKFEYGSTEDGTLLTSITEAFGTSDARTISFGYDRTNLTSITDASDNTTTFAYTGDKITSVDHPGNLVDTTLAYNPSSSYTDVSSKGLTTRYEYDVSGNVIKNTESSGTSSLVEESEYSGNGDLTRETNKGEGSPGAAANFDYETLDGIPTGNKIEEQLQSNGNIVSSSYSYASESSTGAQNNVAAETTSSGKETINTYDSVSNLVRTRVKVKDGTFLETGSTYDSYGNQLKQSNPVNRTYNMVINQDFEIDNNSDNKPDYWTDYSNATSPSVVARSSSYKVEGDVSLKIYRTSSSSGTFSGVKSNFIPVTPGKTYTVSTWLYTQSSVDTNATVHVYWYKTDGTASSIKLFDGYVIGNHKNGVAWKRYSGRVSPPSDAAYAKVMPILYGNGQAFYDCIQFEEGPIVSTYNPLVNSSFENWTSGLPDEWTKSTNATVSQGTSYYASGVSSLRLRSLGDYQPFVSQYVTISANQEYSVSGWIKTSNLNDARIHARYYDANKTALGSYYSTGVVGPNKAWTFGTVNMGKAPSNAKYIRILPRINYDTSGTGDAWFDSITIHKEGIEKVNGYSSNGNYLTSQKDTFANQTSYTYTSAGNVQNETDPHGVVTRKGYDLLNRITSVTLDYGTGKTNAVTYYDYDKNDNLTSVRDAESTGAGHRTTTYSYNQQNQVTGVKDALGNITSYSYDNRSNLSAINMPSGRVLNYGYDGFNRLSTIGRSDGVTISYTRNAEGSPTSARVIQNGNTTSYKEYDYYDDQSLKVEREGTPSAANYNVNYTYDADGNTTSVVEKNNTSTLRTINKRFDYQDNLTSLKASNESVTVGFSYNPLGNMVRQTRQGSNLFTDYDSEGRPTDIMAKASNGTSLRRYNYAYDEHGNITAETGSITNRYTYDSLDRLKTWNNGSTTTSYSYDKVGNILSATSGSTTTNYEYRDDNSLWKKNGQQIYSYDADGNMTRNDTWNYTYDAEGRLTQAANGTTTASYSYDHQGRRISKTVNGTTTKYKYDGWNVLREMNASDQTIAEYTYDQANRPVSMRRGGATYYYIYNARGDITAVVNSSGTMVNTYSYDPWGKILSVSETVENPFRYASYRYDTETGLYYLQNRYYNPDIMRFITRDAIRDVPGIAQTSNYYMYSFSNPINYFDPSGLGTVTIILKKDFLRRTADASLMTIAAIIGTAVGGPVVGLVAGALAYILGSPSIRKDIKYDKRFSISAWFLGTRTITVY